jgi:ribosomal protein L29
MQSKTDNSKSTLNQLREELLTLKAAIKRTLEDLKAELAGLRADLREEE